MLLPLVVLLKRLRQGCRFAIEFPPELSGLASDLTQQGVCLQLSVEAAFAPDNPGLFAQEHMCLLWIPGAGVPVQTLQVLALAIKEGLVLPAPPGEGGGGESWKCRLELAS